ncbi:hypothetical protein [Aliarcobacter butzleri]|jgi:hypothetical protein|uniref:hypothetical protein n=1 Tax=Aliarcobacter butzleri TaxID=28197 RepID=UPI0024DE79BC|nr:hypothetical protein [Aliarcobacter butzleri]MDK2047207.1 hypothetical protein [Aliarcobacter butzleri]
MQIGKNLKKSKEKNSLVLNIPSNLNQKLIDGYRVKLFAKIKDSLDRKKQSVDKEQIELKEWIDKKSFNSLNPINNSWFSPMIRA